RQLREWRLKEGRGHRSLRRQLIGCPFDRLKMPSEALVQERLEYLLEAGSAGLLELLPKRPVEVRNEAMKQPAVPPRGVCSAVHGRERIGVRAGAGDRKQQVARGRIEVEGGEAAACVKNLGEQLGGRRGIELLDVSDHQIGRSETRVLFIGAHG